MSLDPNDNRNDYIGNNAVSVYSYGFKIFNKSHLLVKTRSALGVESTLILDTDYTVDGVGESVGGNITLIAGNLATGIALTILGRMPIEQENDLGNQGSFYPETIEEEFDKLAMVDQQQQEQISRTLILPDTIKIADFNPTLPTGITDTLNKGKAIILNEDCDGFTLGDSDLNPVSYSNISSNTTLDEAVKNYFADPTAGAFTVTLPLASDNAGNEFTVKHVAFGSANDITVARTASDLIDGETSDTLTAGDFRTYISNGSNYFIKN